MADKTDDKVPGTPAGGESEHGWVHEMLGAYVAGGLDEGERQRFDTHINGCAECFDAFIEARDADRMMQRTMGGVGGLAAGEGLEERVVTFFREKTMNRWARPIVRRAVYATAAAVALAATGVFANYAIRQEGRFNNPLSEALVSGADARAPELARTIDGLTRAITRGKAGVEQSPGQKVAVATDRPGVNGTSKMRFEFNDVPTSVILSEMSGRFGFKFDVPAGLPSNITISVPEDLDKEGAVKVLNDILVPQGYTVMDVVGGDANKKRIVTINEAKKSRLKVFEESDPNKIPLTDDLVTYVIPLKNVDAVRMRSDLTPLLSADADIAANAGSNSVVITDTSAKIHRFAEIVAKLDQPKSAVNMEVRAGDWGIDGKQQIASGRGVGQEFARQYDSEEHLTPFQNQIGERKLQQPAQGQQPGQPGVGAPLSYSGGIAGGVTKVGTGTLTLDGGTLRGSTVVSAGNGVQSFNQIQGESLQRGEGLAAGPASADGRILSSLSSVQDQMEKKTLSEDDKKLGEKEDKSKVLDLTVRDRELLNTELALREEMAGIAKKSNKTGSSDADAEKNGAAGVASGDSHEEALSRHATPILGDLPALVQDFKRTTDNQKLLAANDPNAPAGSGAATQPGAAPAPATPAPTVTAATAGLKIIRNGTIEFEVRSFDDAYQAVAKIVGDEKGFVSSTSSDKLANGKVRGVIVVRVPPERLDRFLLSIRALGDLKAQQIAANDVTKEYTDTDSELRGLRTMETRLLDLIKNGKGEVKDLIAAETKLGETRVQIEKLEGQLKYFDNLVGMATISIVAYEKDIQTPTAASEQENVAVNVETEEVEAKYQAARKIFDDAKSHMVESQLRNVDAEHVAAHIVADVPPERADFVAGQLKGLGKVVSFNRDRRQSTSGGTGAPPAGVEVKQKETRITVDLFNLANLVPRETTVLRVAVRDVEGSYRAALELLRKDARRVRLPGVPAAPAPGAGGDLKPEGARTVGHIVASNLTGQRPEQMTADVRAEVRSDQADAVLAVLRQSGEVLTSTVAANPDNAGTTSAKRGLQITLVNIASVAPKEVMTVNVAVRDVEAAYKNLLALVRKDAPVQQGVPVNPLLPATTGRVLASNLNGQQPEQMTADVRAEVRSDQADAVMQALRDAGELLNNSVNESPENMNLTQAKRGLQVRFINVAAIPARETVTLRAVAADVPAAYGKLLGALQAQAGAGGNGGDVRIISSQFNQSDARNVNATLAFEVRRAALPAVEKAFGDAGVDFLSRNINRSTDTAGTLDSKVRFQVDELRAAETLEPRRTFTVGMEVEDVEKAMEELRAFTRTLPATPGGAVKEMDFSVTRDASGRATGHVTLDFPVADTLPVLTHVRDLHGVEKNNQVMMNSQVPDTRFAKERVDLTLVSKAGIVQSDKGLWQSIRAALSSAAGALLYSVYLVVTGLLFVLPFVLIIWPVMVIVRRRRAT